MAKVELKLRDGQNLGYIQIRNGKPYYDYPEHKATSMTVEEAVKMCNRFSDIYKCIIHREKHEIVKSYKKIEIV